VGAGQTKLPPPAVGMAPTTEAVPRLTNCTTCHR